ncbi:MAG: D-alanine--D-alanine ligase [Candidatus Omnitrophota bacterium]
MVIEKLKKYKIGVLAGGVSSEREISLKSGKAVFEAFSKCGLNTVFLDVEDREFERSIKGSGIDLAFIALHGKFGEDGAVQERLAAMNILYTGSPPAASRNALDKIISKEIFKENGILIAEHEVIKAGEGTASLTMEPPYVVKPRREGSSIGLTVVFTKEKLESAVKEALLFGSEALVEKYIAGREITVGILENKALPIVEIIPGSGTYDFHSKYSSDKTKYIVPAEFDKHVYLKAQKDALKAHSALGCKGFSRVDMMVTGDNDVFILEVNTIPGLTERSLLPMAAREAGLDFSRLCVRMVLAAISGQSEQKKSKVQRSKV